MKLFAALSLLLAVGSCAPNKACVRISCEYEERLVWIGKFAVNRQVEVCACRDTVRDDAAGVLHSERDVRDVP